ncbi:IclR family transcriptional regulator domain-containing protein [Bordetella hinzii]|uniref:IclR family transcriptional regulator domain-containing protein n=1 Tax=Bordetella hinzii TaxID=103855 RepID=UPI001C01888B|nr:IclR family transcriptional regulator C-terminal domain-containing protein [Bordetella hinzii]QWF39905.1 helix-turn-helix domain-containing protein [Bordetella hinzii]QWF44452.1 helix-turn-helix domain-containing protein [Bordetella hinzii]QWF48988.1 helix-turn-helix domain-containing protein [Bordetella hinzii]QWF53525.1 helix-turn-helix domain-containing protein [Bordetella hinzii]QWF58014.1 helix-turn-helix domain-containing protein [Bordetella hinzii]
MATPESESFVRTFARGLKIIETMGQGDARQTLADIAAAVELPRTAVRRFLMTLIELSFVKTDGKHYWLTPKVLRLGLSYLYTLPYWRQSQLSLEELGARIGQSCAVSVLDDEEIVYVQRLHTKRILSMSPSLGSRLPAHAVSMGRVLLSGLDDEALEHYLRTATLKPLTTHTVVDRDRLREAILLARKQSYAWVDSELDDSIAGLAVPVRDQDGGIVAAINVSLSAGTYTETSAVAEFLQPLRQIASQLRSTMVGLR